MTEIPCNVNQEVTNFWGGGGGEAGDGRGNFQDTQKGKKPKALGTMSNIFKGLVMERGYADRF